MSQIQSIIRKTFTEALTFTGKPTSETIKLLKASGFKYENGNWYRSQTDSRLIVESEVATNVAA